MWPFGLRRRNSGFRVSPAKLTFTCSYGSPSSSSIQSGRIARERGTPYSLIIVDLLWDLKTGNLVSGPEVRCQSGGWIGGAGKARRRGIVGAIPRRSNAASVVEPPPNLVTDFGFGTLGLRRDDDHATRVDPVDLAVEAAVYALETQTGGLEHPDQLGQRVEADVVPVQVVAAAIRRDRDEGHVVAARHEVQLAALEIDHLVRARARFVRHLISDDPLAVDQVEEGAAAGPQRRRNP